MNDEFTDYADTGYKQAEQKAAQYFTTLHMQVKEKTYVPTLTEDIQIWKKSHIHRRSWLSFLSKGKRKPDSKDYHRYLGWLNHTGKLHDYLDRSVSYMYMRDLGKALDSPHTQHRIQRMVADIRNKIIHSSTTRERDQPEIMSLAGVYRWAQKEGVETAIIWVIDKLKNVSSNIPKEMNAEQAQRKLIKIIIGVMLHVMEELNDDTPPKERARKLDEAIRLGYSYGLAYPFIDDLLDSSVLSVQEKVHYSEMIRIAILTRSVPDFGRLVRRQHGIYSICTFGAPRSF